MFKRLIQKIAKPRTKKKEAIIELRFTFEVFNDNPDEAKADVKRFKDWLKDQFTEWDDSILQYFLYAYGLQQDPKDEKYKLEVHISNIVKDESATVGEMEDFMRDVKKDLIEDGKEEYIEDPKKKSDMELEDVEPEEEVVDEEKSETVEVRKKPQKQIKLKDV